MKKTTLTLTFALLALPVFAALQMVDVTTRTTNTIIHTVYPGILFTNFSTNAFVGYSTVDTNAVQIGDTPTNAFVKINANFAVLSPTNTHSVIASNLVCNQLYTNGNFQASVIGGIVLASAVATAANVTFISTTGTVTNWPFQTGLGIVQTDIVGMNIPIDPNQIFYLTNYSQGSLTNANLIR